MDFSRVSLDSNDVVSARGSQKKWFPYSKGGAFRKWYGNNDYVVNFINDGAEICEYIDNTPGVKVGSNGRVINREYYFRPAVTWSLTSSFGFGARFRPEGYIFDVNGMSLFADEERLQELVGFLNSKVTTAALAAINPTMAFQVGDICKLPVVVVEKKLELLSKVKVCIEISKENWDSLS